MKKLKKIFNPLGEGIDIAVNGVANLSAFIGMSNITGLLLTSEKTAPFLELSETPIASDPVLTTTTGAVAFGVVLASIKALKQALQKLTNPDTTPLKKAWYDTRLRGKVHLMPYASLAMGAWTAATFGQTDPETAELFQIKDAKHAYFHFTTSGMIIHHTLLRALRPLIN